MEATAAIDIPAWVPDHLHAGYREISLEHGEEQAASWARSAKNGRALAWDDKQVAYLRRRWDEGASASTIAVEIGFGATRNAVIGKLHRLGINAGDRAAKKPQPGGKPRIESSPRKAAAPRAAPRPAATAPKAIALCPGPIPAPKPAPAPVGGVPFLEVGTFQCRMVVAGEGMASICCGAGSVRSSSCCEAHYPRIYAGRATRDEERLRAELRRRGAA